MRKARVPSGPILSMRDAVVDAQFTARGMVQSAQVLRGPDPTAAAADDWAPDADVADAAGAAVENGPTGPARGVRKAAFAVPAMLPVLSGTPGATRWAGPELGQHTDWILRTELGMSDERIQELRRSKAIG